MSLHDHILQTLGVGPVTIEFGASPHEPGKFYRYNADIQRIEFQERTASGKILRDWSDSVHNRPYVNWRNGNLDLAYVHPTRRWLYETMGRDYRIRDTP